MSLVFIAKAPPQRRFVDTPSPREAWQIQHQIADKHYSGLRDFFAQTFRNVQQQIPQQDISRLITEENVEELVLRLSTIWSNTGEARLHADLPRAIQAILDESAQALIPSTQAAIAPQGIAIAFDVAHPTTLAWIDQYVGEQVVGIGDATRQAIRETVRRGFEEGRGVAQMARDMRTHIGLTRQQSTALARYEQGLRDAGISGARLQERVEKRAARMLRIRARNIARTESIDAAAAGQQQLWASAERQGLWDDTRIRRFWIVTPDDRLCQICAPIPSLNVEGRRLREPFQTPIGPTLHPTVHPS